jgi:acetyl esterase
MDPHIKAMLDEQAAAAAGQPTPSLDALPPEMVRAGYRMQRTAQNQQAPKDVETRDLQVGGAAGPIGARLYVPAGAPAVTPGLVYFHGGGFAIGDLETHDGHCRRLASYAGIRVLAVDYRLAPEHPFPAAYEDCRTVWQAMQAGQGPHAINLRRLVVIGDSAGGNLAAALCLGLRDDGQPLPGAQVLIYPGLGGPCDLPSRRDCMDAPLLSSADTDCYLALYLRGSDQPSPYAMPLLAVDFSGLPKAFIAVAQFDPLRDDGRLYAERLQAAGVATVLYPGKGLVHGCLRARRQVPEVDRLYDDLFNYLGSEGLTQV